MCIWSGNSDSNILHRILALFNFFFTNVAVDNVAVVNDKIIDVHTCRNSDVMICWDNARFKIKLLYVFNAYPDVYYV